MRFFIVAFFLVDLCIAAPAQSASTCGNFSTYTNPQSEKTTCYLIQTSWASWNEAEADCMERGGHLASIHGLWFGIGNTDTLSRQTFNSFLRNAARDAGIYDSFHIGLTDARFGSGFAWSDESVLNYSNFGPGIPNINYGHCMYLQIQNLPGLSSGLWFNEQCDGYELPYVCTKN